MLDTRSVLGFVGCGLSLLLIGCGPSTAVDTTVSHTSTAPAPDSTTPDTGHAVPVGEGSIAAEALPLGFEKIKFKVDHHNSNLRQH